VLQGLGWNVHRIWTVDWWDNCEKEMERLLSVLKERENAPADVPAPKAEAPKQAAVPVQVMTVAAAEEVLAPIYEAVVLRERPISSEAFLLPENTYTIQRIITRILDAEAPVCEGMLMRRLMQSVGIGRAGSRLQARTEAILAHMDLPKTTQSGQKVYWRKGQDPKRYTGYRASGVDEAKRDAKDVPVQEIANAVCAVLDRQIGLPREDLFRETAKLLGYRSGALVVEAMRAGFALAKTQGRVHVDANGYVSLPTAGA